MPRAKRFFIPNYVWHITDRCVNKEFLLRFKRDRRRWLFWMGMAKQRYKFSILNYTVTSNHIHCLMLNNSQKNHIAKAMHLASGRTAQEYNERKDRHGSFWGDRYHATAIETGKHLNYCLFYIDLNMVRAGIVSHPKEWDECGYQEISCRKSRNLLIDIQKLCSLLGYSLQSLSSEYEQSMNLYMKTNDMRKNKMWTESIAVGSEQFVMSFQEKLGIKARKSSIQQKYETFFLTNNKKA